MMNNTINDAQGYTTPDRQAMKASQTHFNTLVADQTFAFLPAIQGKALYARDQLNTYDRSLGDHLKRTVASLNNVGFNSTLARLDEIQTLPIAAASLREEKSIELVKYCAGRVEGARGPVETAAGYLRQALNELGAIGFAEEGAELLRIQVGRRAGLEQQIAGLRDDRAKLQEEKRVIDAQIEKLQAPGWRGLSKKLIPSAKDIESAIKLVTTPAPDREFLEQVLARLNGNLEGIENGRCYSNLTQARDGVRSRLDKLQKELTDTDSQLQDAASQLQKLEAIKTLDQVIANWGREAQKILAAYEQFLQANPPSLIVDVPSIQAMAGRYTATVNFLGSISWR
ncbi:hypothetical protein PS914_00283 [Pseudomonas fluorescens]|uniref:alpha-xenorhabdolysin family binary toxin subunit B n=1 Tax=Pseudomonas fluorescens TaxID=294 RepID=UPI0012536244|nr:alpha-xenorhabdolysin family binary toxin subunit B [Pseudomonas fluorescens]VVP66212.1 hypothetical protein PS914_00283 [Pseudomonas fluorescens]